MCFVLFSRPWCDNILGESFLTYVIKCRLLLFVPKFPFWIPVSVFICRSHILYPTCLPVFKHFVSQRSKIERIMLCFRLHSTFAPVSSTILSLPFFFLFVFPSLLCSFHVRFARIIYSCHWLWGRKLAATWQPVSPKFTNAPSSSLLFASFQFLFASLFAHILFPFCFPFQH